MNGDYKKATKAADHLGAVFRHVNRAREMLMCHSAEELGIKYTDEQREILDEAQHLASTAEKKVDEVYREILGRLMLSGVKRYK